MDQKKIINELLELGGSLERMQRKVQELLKAFDVPEPNPQKRRNLKAERIAEINDYRATHHIKGTAVKPYIKKDKSK